MDDGGGSPQEQHSRHRRCGIKYSGDLAKANRRGCRLLHVGSLLAGTDESPGEVFLYQGAAATNPIAAWDRWAPWPGLSRSLFQQEVRGGLSSWCPRAWRRGTAFSSPAMLYR